ncbi:MAG: hypothetical protein Q4D62_15295 [Planctomycetia bacterium]|nr:hypothetical protein [Planctomycetia bacterium]
MWMEVTSALTAARPELPKKISPKEPKNHDLGYSRGGCGTKIHLVCDANGNYMNAVLSAGQEHETQHFEAVVSSISVPYVAALPNAVHAEFVVTKVAP